MQCHRTIPLNDSIVYFSLSILYVKDTNEIFYVLFQCSACKENKSAQEEEV